MEVAAFIALAAALAGVSAWRGEHERARAFVAVFVGLVVTAATRDHGDGWIAFSIWTLVSYTMLIFPVAATLYLVSAFCYILELQGRWLVGIQVVSNFAGLAGLVAVYRGNPMWRITGGGWLGLGGSVALDRYTKAGSARASLRDEGQSQ